MIFDIVRVILAVGLLIILGYLGIFYDWKKNSDVVLNTEELIDHGALAHMQIETIFSGAGTEASGTKPEWWGNGVCENASVGEYVWIKHHFSGMHIAESRNLVKDYLQSLAEQGCICVGMPQSDGIWIYRKEF